jgi:glutathione synthase/RimK-type ligase-like ATP-grasp enzyme
VIVRVLVTSSRLPAAIEEIRKLGRTGHEVLASDTFASSPGSHSKHVKERFVTASPTFDTAKFLDDIEAIVAAHPVDLLMPAFEEVYYLAKHRDRIERHTELFTPSFEVLRELHDKERFLSLASRMGFTVPATRVATSRRELAKITREMPGFFARAAYSRGGVKLFTDTGPLAGGVSLEDCEPTVDNPFLVQPFVEGEDLCTYSIVHHGEVAAHATYVHPLTIEHSGGITFESIDEPRTLEVTRRVVEEMGYHGQLGLDFIRTDDDLVVVECNPRPTAGLAVMPDEMFDRGLRNDTGGRTLVAPAGAKRMLSLAIIRNMVLDMKEMPEDLDALVSSGKDIYADPKDIVPLLYQFIAYSHVIGYRMRAGQVKRSDLMQGYFYDICWNGDEI